MGTLRSVSHPYGCCSGEPEVSSDHLPVTLLTPGQARQPVPGPPGSAPVFDAEVRPHRPPVGATPDKCSASGPPICNRYLSGVR